MDNTKSLNALFWCGGDNFESC